MTPRVASMDLESPALAPPDAGPAYELKFLMDEAQSQVVETWARARLAVDPHGHPALDGAYRTTSLYCDTPDLDVYHRTPWYKRRKFRVRRYGSAAYIFLERKSKRGDRVAKRRTPLPEEELSWLGHPMSLVIWQGHWFHRRLLARRLSPVCRVAYQRAAFAGSCSGGPLRLTLDRRVRGILTSDWSLVPLDGGMPLLPGQVILELKFQSALPAPFKELVHDLRLNPFAVSKYRRCLEVWGVPLLRREVADA